MSRGHKIILSATLLLSIAFAYVAIITKDDNLELQYFESEIIDESEYLVFKINNETINRKYLCRALNSTAQYSNNNESPVLSIFDYRGYIKYCVEKKESCTIKSEVTFNNKYYYLILNVDYSAKGWQLLSQKAISR